MTIEYYITTNLFRLTAQKFDAQQINIFILSKNNIVLKKKKST